MSTEAQPAAAEGPLSVEQAVGLLEAPETVEPEAEAEPIEGDPEPEITDEPEEAGEGEDEAEQPEPETPAVEPPHFWDAEAKAKFAELPPELQGVVLEQEKGREAAKAKAVQEAAESRKRADAELSGIAQLSDGLAKFLPEAVKTFQDRWANVDWAAWAEADPDAAIKGRFQFENEQRQLGQVHAAKQEAERITQTKFLAEENEKLKTLAPALTDPAKGQALRGKVAQYLVDQGADPKGLETLPAAAVAVAYKAYLYDQAQAGLKTKPTAAVAPRAPVKPAASQTVRTPQREAEAVKNRFAQTGSVDDAVAMLNARQARKAS